MTYNSAPIVIEIHVSSRERRALEAFFDDSSKTIPIQAVNDGAQAFYRDGDGVMMVCGPLTLDLGTMPYDVYSNSFENTITLAWHLPRVSLRIVSPAPEITGVNSYFEIGLGVEVDACPYPC